MTDLVQILSAMLLVAGVVMYACARIAESRNRREAEREYFRSHAD